MGISLAVSFESPSDLHRQADIDVQADGDAGAADLLTQIARLDLAALADLDRCDIGTDRTEIVGSGFGEQGAGIITAADDGGIGEIGRPVLPGSPIDHGAIPGAVGGDDRGAGNLDFLLLERRGHWAASRMSERVRLRFWRRQGAECAMTSPMIRMAGPPSTEATRSGNCSRVPTAAFASGRVTRAKTPTGVSRERPAASRPSRTLGAAVMPM